MNQPLLLVCLSVLYTSSLRAEIIGINFQGNETNASSPNLLSPSDAVGEIAAANWNNASGATGSISNVKDDSGSTTTIDVTWAGQNTWSWENSSRSVPTAAAGAMFNGYLDTSGNNGSHSITVSQVHYAHYDVYVYCDGENIGSSRLASYRMNGGAPIWINDSANWNGTYVEGTGTSSGNATSGANHVHFKNLTGPSLTFTATAESFRAAVNGFQIVETTPIPGLPEVATLPATSITTTTATMNGDLLDNGEGSDSAFLTLYWGTTDGGGVAGDWTNSTSAGSRTSPGTFDIALSAFAPNTTYFYRAFASNAVGTDWATTSVSFQTPTALANVQNIPASNLLASSATVGAQVIENGGGDPVVTLHFGNNDGGTTAGQWDNTVVLGSPGSAALSALLASTTYYFRAQATNAAGDSWAPATSSFTTLMATLPSIVTNAATGLQGNFATLNGTVTETGNDPPSVSFFYGTVDGGTFVSNWQAIAPVGVVTSGFARVAKGLQPLTTYHVRTRAMNAAGEAWAPASTTFTTPILTLPSIVTNEIHYDESDKTLRAEFIELHNPSAITADLSGYAFTKGIDYTFPNGTTLPAGAYLVVAQDPATMQSHFGYASAMGPFANGSRLKNSCETITLQDPGGNTIDEVDYALGWPWPTVGQEVGSPLASPSIELIGPWLDNNLAGSWRSSGFESANRAPTPGAANRSLTTNAPPQMRQVNHAPVGRVLGQDKSILPGEAVIITAKVTDPNGVASVMLEYQVVEPGDYLKHDDPRYTTEWTSISMLDNGTGGDALAADGSYTVTLPGALQTHRRLIRYRIEAVDSVSASVRGPYADDPSRNFAYFVYGTLPTWNAGGTAYNFTELEPVPVYHLITTREDHEESQHIPDTSTSGYTGSDYLWGGTVIYEGKVYDHVPFRARGGVWRYAMGKNMWKFNFNRGQLLEARDNYGKKYTSAWDKLNFSSLIQQGNFGQRGEQGLFEGAGFKLHHLLGNSAPDTHYVHFRIIEYANESGLTASPYDDDFRGLYMAIEQLDGKFLDAHDLPDGNLYKMEGGSGELNNQGATLPKNKSDLNAFLGAFDGSTATAQWWQDNLVLDDYYNFYAAITAIHDNDIAFGKNYFFYHRPVDALDPHSNKWQVINWDLDLTWTTTYQLNSAPDDRLDQDVLAIPEFAQDYRNRMREVRDLLFNTDQTGLLLDEIAQFVHSSGELSFVDADKAMWDTNPILTSSHIDSGKAGHNKYWESTTPRSFANMVQHLKNYVATRSSYIDTNVLTDDAQVPNTPTITYTGESGYPVNQLQFTSSTYASPSGSAFAAMEWRLAEITPPAMLTTLAPPKYEIQADWESDELTTFSASIYIPTLVKPGGTYRARGRHRDGVGRWGHWSDPVEFVTTAPDLTPYTTDLRVTELHYHPSDATLAEQSMGWTTSDFEYLELKNLGPVTIDLTDVRFTKGIDFDFPPGTLLNAGSYVLVLKNQAAFESRYGTELPIAGEWASDNKLSNGGENVKLSFGAGITLIEFTYDDKAPWPNESDGTGFSLTLHRPEDSQPADHANPLAWRASATSSGSPGTDDHISFSTWAADNNIGAGASPTADPDEDGIHNLFEYFLASSPTVPSEEAWPDGDNVPLTISAITENYFTLTFRHQTSANDVNYVVDLSDDMITWDLDSGVLFSRTFHPDSTATDVWRAPMPSVDPTVRKFIRLRIQTAP